MKNFTITGTYTDLYQLTMAQVYYLTGKSNQEAVFDYFYRKNPYEGGYTIFAGLGTLLEVLQDIRFTQEDIEYLKRIGLNTDFAESLADFQFKGTVYSVKEGEVIFPNEPILRLEGSIVEAQIVETLLLNILNFQSLIATKAARIRSVSGDRVLSDFGLRRSQGTGGYHATRAAFIGGFNSTSNVKAAHDFGIPAVGTMAHSFIQSYDDELSAFRDFALNRPDNCILLVDTYDTLKSGVPNAIEVAKEMKARGQRLLAVRLDSGDLAYLSKKVRKMLDDAGFQEVKITASNQLDEWVIKSLDDQGAPIDIFGIGTSLVTGAPDAALDGVYKLSYSNGKPRIKLSENLKKLTLPDKKQVHRVINGDGRFFGADVVLKADEHNPDMMYHPSEPDKSLSLQDMKQEPLLHKVMENGQTVTPYPSLQSIASYCQERLSLLPDEHKRFYYPHVYKVGISETLLKERNELKNQYKK
ncbi:nicotinate phosphoribosyltransferase [Fulvivirga kasyanovii]|uniref:Nicotinate phosphoribosyltransferase n=1 Tax=Fulvivirga kasyanovii TaxID=396812 RepID=A0ABW9RT20_9BACT|nr:nicotinate phosphoribosyltransferase [Fulvivirga kasyanovii]MTI26160.1 nicotinate phosphoribosyltransferase [Fulvivirga kasyanovii]